MVDNFTWIWDNPLSRGLISTPGKAIELVFPKGTSRNSIPYMEKRTKRRNYMKRACKTLTRVTEIAPLRMLIIPAYSRWFIRLAGISGASAVALGAYGAHVFYQRDYPEELKQVYETANRYHFLHTLALLGVPLCRRPKLAGPLLALGTLIFSGTCYYYALTGSRAVRQFTPYGGMLLIFGWLAMVL